MKRLQKPPVAEAKTSKKEPLAEGLQVVPVDSAGRRIWRDISDEKVVDIARKFIEERGITGRRELYEADCGLYEILRKRRLLDEVGFEVKRKNQQKRRPWSRMNDNELVEFARKFIEERGITGRKELYEVDCGLYSTLRIRRLLSRVGFVEKRRKERSWKDMGNGEIIEYAQKVIEEKEIIGRKDLKTVDRGLYQVLCKRGLVDFAFANIEKQRTDDARDAVIDALSAFGSENKIGVV